MCINPGKSLMLFGSLVLAGMGLLSPAFAQPTPVYLTGEKTGNYINKSLLGSGTADISSPIQKHTTTIPIVGTLVFQFFYGTSSILNGTTTTPTTLKASRDFGLAGLLGIGSDVYLQFRNTGNTNLPANITVYFKLKEKPQTSGISVAVGGLLGLVELQNIKATAYNGSGNYTLSGSGTVNEGTAVSTGTPTKMLIDATGEWYAAFTPTVPFNAARLTVAIPTDLSLADVSTGLTANLYNVFTQTPGTSCSQAAQYTSPGEVTGITLNTGVLGLQLSEFIANPQYALNNNASQYASYAAGLASVSALGSISQTLHFDHIASTSDGIRFRLGLQNSLISLSLLQLNNIKFYAYNGTSEIPVATGELGNLISLFGLNLLDLVSLGSTHRELNLVYTPGVAFDRVKIEFSPGTLNLGVLGDAFRVYQVSLAPEVPTITTPPAATTVCEGQTAAFTVAASGNNLSYQWQQYDGSTWSAIGTATNTNLSFPATLGLDQSKYRVLITGGNSGCLQSITSPEAGLTVHEVPDTPPVSIN